MTEKLNVAVLFGGDSTEHEISLITANYVINHLDRSKFDVVPIGIDKEGQWYLHDVDKLLREKDALVVHTHDSQLISLPQFNRHNHKLFDVAFPAMHGPLYEDGCLQGLLELANVPYVGCGVLASAIAMDKDIAKRLVQLHGIHVPKTIFFHKDEYRDNQETIIANILQAIEWPIFIKPANIGSSVGIRRVFNEVELRTAIDYAFNFDYKVVAEQAIIGQEVEIAVLENINDRRHPLVSIPGEIRPSKRHGFYSYDAKYLDKEGAELIIPANLTPKQVEHMQTLAADIFYYLECNGMARIDFLIDEKTGDFYFNELNTIPGFTPISMYPRLWEASGRPYQQLLSDLIDLAFARYAVKRGIKREYQ